MSLATFLSKRKRTYKLLKNLFGTPVNAIISVMVGILLFKVLQWVVKWGFVNATWVGSTKQMCLENEGACWIFIREKFLFFIYGFVPNAEYWRINLLFILFVALFLILFIKKVKYKAGILISYLVIFPVMIMILAGKGLGLPPISFNLWGGAMLTFVFSVLGLLFSFPLGILLALGRRSKLPVIKYFSVTYIEFFRGVPLIAILFVSSTVLPFFFPPGFEVAKILRVTIGLIFFQSAYLAEVIRGGLQTIQPIQYESADALGLHYVYKMYYVILPQVLRNVIVNIGDISIAFIKDTTLVYIIGLFDMLGIYVPITSDSLWLGTEPEALIFSGLLYWVLCYIVARVIRAADKRLNKSRRGVKL